MKKKILIIYILLSLILMFSSSLSFGTELSELNIQSNSIILIEEETGKIIYEKNAHEKKYPASTTKIMTAILVIENCDLNDYATASEQAILDIPIGGTIANIQIGEKLSIIDLLYGLMLPSGNDAANVLAEYISGSVEDFAKMMTAKANEIGCKNTNFINPHGLHEDEHYTTAYDLALIGQYAMKLPLFREIVSTQTYALPNTDKYTKEERIFRNTNSLLVEDYRDTFDNYYYKYATGIKTGYTSKARNTLVCSAQKDDIEYICVVLDAGTVNNISTRYTDSKILFDYAFSTYTKRTLLSKNNVLQQLEIQDATDDTKFLDVLVESDIIAFVKSISTLNNFVPTVILDENLSAPIKTNDVIGTISYEIDGITYNSKLVAGNDVNKFNINEVLLDMLKIIIKVVIIAFVVFIILGFVVKSRKRKKKKNLIRQRIR